LEGEARMTDPAADLAEWVKDQLDTGDAERDPYGFASLTIKTVLEFALDDGISGSMSEGEFRILERLATQLTRLDPSIEIHPRPA
jgi:hypothetical protein